jgi:hypothetical protein
MRVGCFNGVFETTQACLGSLRGASVQIIAYVSRSLAPIHDVVGHVANMLYSPFSTTHVHGVCQRSCRVISSCLL